ncbi:MAG: 50S ribosomal protein L11 methyltransferase [Candidatus Obscuribacterales bacterium]|nr:50S ribosomal protein L11 methyltransferase [Candidatus Obscuribacterales bacterium]
MTQAVKQDWSAVEFEAPAQDEDMACWLVMQCGALGCEIKPFGEGRVLLHASFKKEELTENAMRKVVAHLEEYGLSQSLNSLKVRQVPAEDWLLKWKEGFEPFRVGTQMVICPSWRKEGLSPTFVESRKVVYIEPGMAFGTGLHVTTQFCLRALESYPPTGDVLDVGTGSGILAMASVLLNPNSRVAAVDTDPVAINSARENLALNELEGEVDMRLGSLEVVQGEQFDLILSNLTCEDIVALLPEYVKLLKPRSKVICAGVLKEKFAKLETAVARYPLTIEHTESIGIWVGLVLQH